jgi:L-fuculose-phosphate aldolase
MVAVACRLSELGLNRGSSGNVSVRLGDTWLVTPSGVAPQALSAQAMVALDFSGQVVGTGKPSSEWRFHRDILVARPEVGGIVHTHSRFATVFACLHRGIPPFHYMIAMAGGDSIRCSPYALFGTQALSDHALNALTGRRACLLGNHGMIALGADLTDALALAIEVESLCEQYWSALQLGEPKLLSAEQMAEVIEKFKGYGRQGQT